MAYLKKPESNFGFLFAKRAAVERAEAVFFEHFVMKFGAIALVPVKTITGKFFMKITHKFIAPNLGDDGGGGNERDFFIAFYYCFLVVMPRREKRTVQ